MTDFADVLAQRGITLSEWIDDEFWDAYELRALFGNLRGLQATADDALKTEDALIREDAPQGSVADMDAWVKKQPRHNLAVEAKKKKHADWTAADLRMKILFAMKDKYQTDAKQARDMDRAQR